MRIISGIARGTKISSIQSLSTRPTLDRVKESLFNILQNEIKDSIVLDLFAGSGALGIEALSRGARTAVFCDKNYEATKVIYQNLVRTHFKENAKVINSDYKKALTNLNKQRFSFDIIFLDPPYKEDLAGNAIKQILELNLLKSGGTIIIETDEITRDNQEINEIIKNNNFKNTYIKDRRKYGRANLIFLSMD